MKIFAVRAFILVMLLVSTNSLYAQDETLIQCGDVLEAELTTVAPRHNYTIELVPGDTITANAKSLAPDLTLGLSLFSPSGAAVTGGTKRAEVEWSALVGATGTYTITVGGHMGAVGIYTLSISCVLQNGTVIEIGGGTVPPTLAPNPIAPPAFGFPGLAPVDFANAVKLPLIPATRMTGAITPTGGEIFGFQTEGNAGDVFDLNVTRISGNLNLGVVMLSADNKVVAYGGLISGDTFSTRITLPSVGQYTIGVFRIDLLPPSDPQATAFQVAGTLNP